MLTLDPRVCRTPEAGGLTALRRLRQHRFPTCQAARARARRRRWTFAGPMPELGLVAARVPDPRSIAATVVRAEFMSAALTARATRWLPIT